MKNLNTQLNNFSTVTSVTLRGPASLSPSSKSALGRRFVLQFTWESKKMETQNRSAKIQITKRKNCIKRLREEVEHFLWRIKEVEKHNNCEEYNSILFEKSDYNKIEGARPDLKKPLKLDGIIIGRHFVDGFRQLERSVRDEFRKVGG